MQILKDNGAFFDEIRKILGRREGIEGARSDERASKPPPGGRWGADAGVGATRGSIRQRPIEENHVLPYNICIMKMLELLEKDKDRVLTELAQAATPEKGTVVLENEMDRLILQYNDQCESEKERDAVAYMMQALRLALPLVDSVGETKVWERETSKAKGKNNLPGIILLILGACLLALGVIPDMVISQTTGLQTSEMTRYAFTAGGAVLMVIAGVLFGRPAKSGSKEHQVELRVDGNKAFRSLRNAMISVDQSLEEIQAAERWSKREQAGTIEGQPVTKSQIDLFADLLTAIYNKDGEYALEKIEDLKYFLHKQQIDVLEYGKDTEQYFDIMPGTQGGTIRPALVSDGKLLKKGLASTGK